MLLFLWQNVGGVSFSYHDGGGLMVVAKSLEEARTLLKSASDVPEDCGAHTSDPTKVYSLKGKHVPEVRVFPNAGCC